MLKYVLLLLPFSLCALESESDSFQGTLLSVSAENVKPGHFFAQPYLFVTHRYGIYTTDALIPTDIMSYSNLTVLQGGLNQYLDFSLLLTAAYTEFSHSSQVEFGDMGLFFGFQLFKETTYTPFVRLVLGETFPTGDYTHLEPTLFDVSAIGSGTFSTTLILALSKIFYPFKDHPLTATINTIIIPSSSVLVSGRSIYGGGPTTYGRIHPGLESIINIGLEQLVTKRLVLGCDFRFEHANRSTFHNLGGGQPAGTPSSDRFSLAPCIEYTFSKEFGMEGGVWFSTCGRNSVAFVSGVIAALWSF